jgi:predicted NACHT family NTPase
LNWRTIDGNDIATLGIDALVQIVRSQRMDKINHQCGILQLLDINRPVSIDHIYIDVNILEQISSQQWLEVSEINSLKPEDIDRFGLGELTVR